MTLEGLACSEGSSDGGPQAGHLGRVSLLWVSKCQGRTSRHLRPGSCSPSGFGLPSLARPWQMFLMRGSLGHQEAKTEFYTSFYSLLNVTPKQYLAL